MPRYAELIHGSSARIQRIRMTHCSGVRNDILYVMRRVNRGRRVCAFRGELCKAGDNQREALTVNDVPVEGIDLTWVGAR